MLGALSSAASAGATQTLRALNLAALDGRPIIDVLGAIVDAFCPEGGPIDEAIARNAAIDSMVELVEGGLTDLDDLDSAHVELAHVSFLSHCIVYRILNDVGSKAVTLPKSARSAVDVEREIYDYVRGCVQIVVSKQPGSVSDLHKKLDAIMQGALAVLGAEIRP